MNYDVVEAVRLSGHRVRLRFRDGLSGEIDLKGDLRGPMFEPLKSETEFRRFIVHEVFHTLVWPNGADMAPEFLYEKVAESNTRRGRSV